MEEVVVDRVAARVHDLRRVQYLVHAGPVPDYRRHAIEGFLRHGMQALVVGRGPLPDGEGAQDLAGVAPVAGADLGDQHVAALNYTLRHVLLRHAAVGLAHGGRDHIVDAVHAAFAEVGVLDDSG